MKLPDVERVDGEQIADDAVHADLSSIIMVLSCSFFFLEYRDNPSIKCCVYSQKNIYLPLQVFDSSNINIKQHLL